MNYCKQIERIGYMCFDILMEQTSGESLNGKWLSSALRGALGSAMLRRCCPEGSFHCENCTHPCSTGIMFGTAVTDRSEEAVNPYIVSCKEDSYQGGELYFQLTFFANGLSAAEDTLLALREGIVIGKEQAKFRLCSVTDAVTQNTLFDGYLFIKPEVHYMQYTEPASNRYCIEFVTPYRSKIKMDEFGFPQLIRAILRRTSTIMRQGGIEPEFDYRAIIESSEQVKTDYRQLLPFKKERYSSRTDSKWEVTGFTGMMIVSGDFAELLPFMRIAEIVGAGKMCVMGLGKIQVSAMVK